MKKSKIILATYLGAITLCIGSFSMSIAWYGSTSHLHVRSIDITIDCDRQLAISTEKDRNFTTELDNDDLDDYGLFTPVTSAYSSNWLSEKKDMPVFYDDTLYTEVESAVTTEVAPNGYFSQKLYLKSDDNVWVSIDANKTFIQAKSDVNVTYAAQLYEMYQAGNNEELKKLTKEEIEERLNSLVNAMRFSILINDPNYYDYAIIDPNKTEVTTYGGHLDNNVDRYYDYFVKDGQYYERLYGEYNDSSLIYYDDPLDEDSDFEDTSNDPSAFNARHKKGIKRINLEKSKGLIIEQEESYSVEDFDTADKPFYIPVYRDKVQEIVLSIYIEGWDLDSINYTMGATFLANMVLKVEGKMEL